MTCAAVGAVYYGWNALSDRERNELSQPSQGLEIGIELIKALVRFVTDKTKELLSPKNIEEIKKFIGSAAQVFGKTSWRRDAPHWRRSRDTFDTVKKKSSEAVDKTVDGNGDSIESWRKPPRMPPSAFAAPKCTDQSRRRRCPTLRSTRTVPLPAPAPRRPRVTPSELGK